MSVHPELNLLEYNLDCPASECNLRLILASGNPTETQDAPLVHNLGASKRR